MIPLVGMLLATLVLMAAFAVDLGMQRASRREMQARADIIALDMVRLADGRTEAQIVAGDATHPTAEAALVDSALRNEVDRAKITGVDWGRWTLAGGFESNPIPAIPNAVLITTEETTDYRFQPGSGDVIRTALAVQEGTAQFQMGSFAARIDSSSGFVLPLVEGLLGPNIAAVDLVGYEGLVDSTIRLGDLFAEIGVLDPEQVAGTTVQLDDLYVAAAEVLGRSTAPTDLANAALIDDLLTLGFPSQTIDLGDLVTIAPGAGQSALDGQINVLDLLTTGAQLSNGVSGAEVQDLALALPGLTDVEADVNIIEPPQVSAFGGVGTSVSTSQISAGIDATLLGGGALAALADVGIHLELGTATGNGEITSLSCATPNSFDVAASTELLTTELEVYLEVVGIPVTVTVTKNPPIASDTVTFTRLDDPNDPDAPLFDPQPQPVEVGQGTLGLASGYNVSTQVHGPVGWLLQPAFDLALNPLLAVITGPLLTTLDATLLGPLVSGLGLNVAGADVAALDMACDGVKLAG